MTEAKSGREDRWVRTSCSNCYAGHDPIKVHVVDGVAVKIEGDPDAPLFEGRICPRANAAIMQLYDPYRVKAPLKRTNPTKGMGVDPGWVEISWEEALNILQEKLTKVKEKNPMQLYYGSMDVQVMVILALFTAVFAGGDVRGGYFAGYGGMCGEPIHQMGTQLHGSFLDFPDLRYSKYVIITGGSLGEGWLAPTIQAGLMAEGKANKGLKVVVIDPRQTHAAAKADEWIPIRPTTDLALFLAMMNVLVNDLGIYDREFLKRQTNAPYLMGDDGHPLRDPATGKPLVWDASANVAKTYDDPTVGDFALEGSYKVEIAAAPASVGSQTDDCSPGEGKPGFHIFKDHIRQYTPEWASEITTIPAATIRRLSKELGEAAQIGSTIVLEGKEYAFRPVAVAGYRGVNNHTNSPATEHARVLLNMLLGASRSPGGIAGFEAGVQIFGGEWPYPYPPAEDGLTSGEFLVFGDVPWKFPFEDVGMRALWPRGMQGVHMAVWGQANPEKYGINEDVLCECLIHWRLNPMMDVQDPKIMAEALAKIPFYVDITTYLDESDDFVDLVLPDVTFLERYSTGNQTWYLEGMNIQQPVVQPLYNSRPGAEVIWELGGRMGMLKGITGMINFGNFMLNSFEPPYIFDPDHDYTLEEFYDAQCKGLWGKGLDWFKEHGHNLRPVPPDRFYYRWGWNQYRLPFYWYKLKAQGEELRHNMERDNVKEKVGLDPDWFCRQYNPVPEWEPCIIDKEDPEYDMYAITFKTAITSHSTFPATNAWLMEIAERDPYVLKIMINSETAKKKGLHDDDLVWVESRVGKVQGRVKLTECIQSDSLGFTGNTGHWMKHPLARGKGTHQNSLIPFEPHYTAPLAPAVEGTAKVKIYRA